MKPIEETPKEREERLLLEDTCRMIAEHLTRLIPPQITFTLFLMDIGAKGNTAYVSTATRETAIAGVREWLEKMQ